MGKVAGGFRRNIAVQHIVRITHQVIIHGAACVKISALHNGIIHHGSVHRLNADSDANLAEHILQDHTRLLTGLIGRLNPDAHFKAVRIAGGGQQFLCLFNVINVGGGRSIIAKDAGTDQAGYGRCITIHHRSAQSFLVNGIFNCLTYTGIIQCFCAAIAIDGHIKHFKRGGGQNRGRFICIQSVHIGGRHIIRNVDFAGFQQSRTLRRFGNHAHLQILGSNRAAPVILVCLQLYIFAFLTLDELVRAGSHRIRCHSLVVLLQEVLGHDAGKRTAQSIQHRGISALCVNDNRVFIHDIHALQPGEIVLYNGAVHCTVKGIFDVLCRQFLAVMKQYALAQVHLQRVFIQKLPAFSQLRNYVDIGIPSDQRVKNIASHIIRCRVFSHVEIERGDIAGLRKNDRILSSGGCASVIGRAGVFAAACAQAAKQHTYSQQCRKNLFHVSPPHFYFIEPPAKWQATI